ncbi:hypothetical protein [Streptomyces sp. 3N207]|uniref:hypothetical protein n=1 Tax=Streptomyces sp. 3N207 TaxID=3457417 RepID=UPI003FD4A2A4
MALIDRYGAALMTGSTIGLVLNRHAGVVRSKGLGIMADGSSGSVSYDDVVVRTSDGWRISCRKVSPRRTPLKRATELD